MQCDDSGSGEQTRPKGAKSDGIMDRLFDARRRLWTLLVEAVS